MNNREWHASFELTKASRITLVNNAASGSERVGFKTRGKSCYGKNLNERWEGNIAHTTLHGIHIGYNDGLPGCLKIPNFLLWKNYDYGVFASPSSRIVVENTVMADNTIGNNILFVYMYFCLCYPIVLVCFSVETFAISLTSVVQRVNSTFHWIAE